MAWGAILGGLSRAGGWLARSGGGAMRSYLGSSVHRGGMTWAKEMYGLRKGMGGFGRTLGLGYMGYTALSGFQEGGAGGAVKGLAVSAAETYAYGAAFKALGITAKGVGVAGGVLGAAAGFGAFYGYAATGVSPMQFLARPYVREHMRKHATLEMARPVVDQFGNLSTIRRRSLAALQRSKITGRSGLANEATLMYRPYFR